MVAVLPRRNYYSTTSV